jgi:hypothetical protein
VRIEAFVLVQLRAVSQCGGAVDVTVERTKAALLIAKYSAMPAEGADRIELL